jgi:hypothetical protein
MLEVTADGRGARVPDFDLLELHQGSAGPELRCVPGHPVAPHYTGVRKAMELAAAQVALQPGESIRVVRRPTGLQGIQVHVVDAQGEVIGRTRYHTLGERTLRTGRALEVKRRVAVKPELAPVAKVRVKPKVKLRGLR